MRTRLKRLECRVDKFKPAISDEPIEIVFVDIDECGNEISDGFILGDLESMRQYEERHRNDPDISDAEQRRRWSLMMDKNRSAAGINT